MIGKTLIYDEHDIVALANVLSLGFLHSSGGF